MYGCVSNERANKLLMNVTAIASTTHALSTNIQIELGQSAGDFAALQKALEAGDVTAARRAYALFRQDVATQAGPATLFSANSQAGHDLQAVGNSLSAADIGGAQTAFAAMERDMSGNAPGSLQNVHHGFGHYLQAAAGAASSIPNPVIANDKT
jgi:hypothetical protein